MEPLALGTRGKESTIPANPRAFGGTQCFLYKRDGSEGVAALIEHEPQEVEGVLVSGVRCQDLLVDSLRLVNSATVVQLHCVLKR